jgi:hypothetical protein
MIRRLVESGSGRMTSSVASLDGGGGSFGVTLSWRRGVVSSADARADVGGRSLFIAIIEIGDMSFYCIEVRERSKEIGFIFILVRILYTVQ